jgi:hypothetical protein
VPVMIPTGRFADGVPVGAAELTALATNVDQLTQLVTGRAAAAGPSSPPVVRLGLAASTGPISAASGTIKTITWGGVVHNNPGPLWSSALPDRITIPVDGWYDITLQVVWDAIGAGKRSAILALNSTSTIIARKDEYLPASNASRVQLQHYDYFSAGDVIFAQFVQTTGSTGSTALYWGGTWMAAEWDGAQTAPGASGGTSGTAPADGGGVIPGGSGSGGGGGGGGSGDDGTQAAVLLSWGSKIGGDEFEYTGAPNPALWGVYDGPGHAGHGRRTPTAFHVDGGVLTCHGDAGMNTGGMAYTADPNPRYHRWEVRAKVNATSSTGQPYHPVLLMWPDTENWPDDGEQDFFETNVGEPDVDAFLHDGVGGGNGSQDHYSITVDITQWHNWAVEWTSTHLRGYCDGVLWFDDTNPALNTSASMHLCIQLDSFFNTGTPMQAADFQVMWCRKYGF